LSIPRKLTAHSSDRHLAAMIGRNTISGVVARVVQVATRFVMVPLVISHLGLGGYGIWSIVMATAGYMRFGSAGLKSAFQKYVAEATGSGDFKTANKLLSTGSILMLALSMVGLIPLAIYSQKLAKVSGVPPEFLAAAAGSITLLAIMLTIANCGAAFEAIVMGGHRIDLTRTFNVVTTMGEAIVIIVLLHFGYGIFAMAATVAVSELVFVLCCYFAARRVVPEISVSARHFTTNVLRELVRYAGSYQLVNILEVLYYMLLPVTILKFFGAEIAGVYAVATRLVTAALMGQDALVLPLLSGGTLMFATGSVERLKRFVKKSFKVTIAVTLVPLAFVAAFGTLMILAWTGQSGPQFRTAILLVCLCAFFGSISRLQLILYRASGNALHDNVRQAFRLGVLAILASSGGLLGFRGVLLGLAAAELAGVVYMFIAMTSALNCFSLENLLPDTMRLTVSTVAMLTAGVIAAMVPTPWNLNERMTAMAKLAMVSFAYLITFWPATAVTKSISTEEQRSILSVVFPWKAGSADGPDRIRTAV
jgi:O-antigen/teichoic acid export membrane protein